MKINWPLIVAISFFSIAAYGDSPLPPPSIHIVCNDIKSHCATSDPAAGKTDLKLQATGETLWSLNQYLRFFRVSHDGNSILALTDYANLAPLNATKSHLLFVIHRNGKSIQSVVMGDLFDHVSSLPKTASHLAWGNVEQIDAKDNVVFQLVDGRKVRYSLITGQRVITQ